MFIKIVRMGTPDLTCEGFKDVNIGGMVQWGPSLEISYQNGNVYSLT